MGSNFNSMILVDKLAKLNSSQQSIETLSHWCIFHMNKAKIVVETWDEQFHRSPREQRLAFLYLANDIIQNSRRKGIDFVTEFWKVLPDSLRDVIENGDEFERNTAFRLINIWEERKVFGSRGQILKEECTKRQMDDENRSWKHKQRPASGSTLDKLISGYEVVNGLEQEEDPISYKCRNAIVFIKKVDEDINAGHAKITATSELKGQNAILRSCIEKLTAIESSRGNLIALLRESLRVQEDKLDQIRNQLQAAQTHSDKADTICMQLLGGSENRQIQIEQSEIPSPATSEPFPEKARSAPQGSSHGVIKEPSSSYSSEKRARIENDPYVPQYTHAPVHVEPNPELLPPPPPSSPPPLPPLPPPMQPQYLHTSMPIPNGPYNYDTNQQIPEPITSYSSVEPSGNGVARFPPSNAYHPYPTDNALFGDSASTPMAPTGIHES